MKMRIFGAALLGAHTLITPAPADICLVAPSLMEIDKSAEIAILAPTSANVRALEQAIGSFEAERFALGRSAQLAAPIERFISSRMSMALAFRASGPDGVRRLASRDDTTKIAETMHSLLSPAACAKADSPGEYGAPQNKASDAPVDGGADTQSENVKGPPPPAAKATPPVESARTVLSTPVSIFALAVVVAIFGGMAFVAIRRRRRGYARFICFLPVDLTVRGAQSATHLIEISQSGAKIVVTKPVAPGDSLLIEIEGVRHDAKAVWANPSCVGLQFNDVIPSQRLTEILQQHGGGFERESVLA